MAGVDHLAAGQELNQSFSELGTAFRFGSREHANTRQHGQVRRGISTPARTALIQKALDRNSLGILTGNMRPAVHQGRFPVLALPVVEDEALIRSVAGQRQAGPLMQEAPGSSIGLHEMQEPVVAGRILGENARKRAAKARAQTPALLKGIIFGPTGCAMTPTHTRKRGRLYRYYMASDLLKHEADCPVRRVPAGDIENAVVDQVRGLLRSPEIIVRTWRTAKQLAPDIDEAEVREALHRLDPLWNELFPAEQARVVQLLVERVDVSSDGLDIRLKTEGLTNIAHDLRSVGAKARAA
jgi:hypothetical protein